MGVTRKYYLHGILLPSGSWISALADTTPASNVDLITEYPAGAVSPTFQGATGAKPEVTFNTPQIGTVLGVAGMTGADLSSGNVDLFYRAAANLSHRSAIANSSHLRVRMPAAAGGKGGVYFSWDRIQAQQDGEPATISCRLRPTWDGTNPPIVPAGSQAISAALLAQEYYTLGPVLLNGSAVPGVKSYGLELGPAYNDEAGDGEPYLSWAGCERHSPVLKVQPRDLDQWATLGLDGLQLTAAKFYLRKLAADAVGPVANGTESHIAFTAADNPCGLATVENISGGEDEAALVALNCNFRIADAATTYPLAVNVASAIT